MPRWFVYFCGKFALASRPGWEADLRTEVSQLTYTNWAPVSLLPCLDGLERRRLHRTRYRRRQFLVIRACFRSTYVQIFSWLWVTYVLTKIMPVDTRYLCRSESPQWVVWLCDVYSPDPKSVVSVRCCVLVGGWASFTSTTFDNDSRDLIFTAIVHAILDN